MSLMGADGMAEVNRQGCDGAHYLAEKLVATGKCKLTFPNRPFLNEFCLTTSVPAQKIVDRALEEGILAGVQIADDRLLIAVTEMQTVKEMDRLVEIVKSL